jgi:hypothetical protein
MFSENGMRYFMIAFGLIYDGSFMAGLSCTHILGLSLCKQVGLSLMLICVWDYPKLFYL